MKRRQYRKIMASSTYGKDAVMEQRNIEDFPLTGTVTREGAPVDALLAAGTVDEFRPDISKRTRTVAYFALGIGAPAVGLGVAVTAAVVPAVAPDAAPAILQAVTASGLAVLAFLGTVAGVFGITYRPTR